MQKYIVLEITRNAEGNIGVYPSAKETENAAWKKYHQILSNAADSTAPWHGAMILDVDGFFILDHKAYPHPVPEPEVSDTGSGE